MNIKRVKYKMSKEDNWSVGYMIGSWDGANTTLLNEKLEYVPKITSNGKEFTAYDSKDDFDKYLNITIPM